MADNRDNRRSKKGNKGREKDSEWQERVVQIRRVTKVVKGGKKLSFRAIVVVGNEKGQVGVGVGKASDVIGAVKKGVADGKKHLVEVPLNKAYSIPHPSTGRAGGARVFMRPAAPGTGVIAGGAMRAVLEIAGVHNVLAKCYGSTNPVNVVRATFNGLRDMCAPDEVAAKRGKTVEEILN